MANYVTSLLFVKRLVARGLQVPPNKVMVRQAIQKLYGEVDHHIEVKAETPEGEVRMRILLDEGPTHLKKGEYVVYDDGYHRLPGDPTDARNDLSEDERTRRFTEGWSA